MYTKSITGSKSVQNEVNCIINYIISSRLGSSFLQSVKSGIIGMLNTN